MVADGRLGTYEEVVVAPEKVATWAQVANPLWWLRTGDSWTAPADNNGSPYLPGITNQFLRDALWYARNPLGNFVGHVIGIASYNRTVRGAWPVMATTGRDVRPDPILGWRYTITNRVFPFVNYWGGTVEFYIGWRPYDGAFGFKFALRQSAFSDQPNYPTTS